MDSRASGFTDTRGFREEYDRFIPSRPTNHLGYAQCMLTEGRKVNDPDCSPSKLAYRQLLAQALGVDRTRIFSFKSKTPPPRTLFPDNFMEPKISKPRRHIEKICESTLDAPNLLDDGGLNLLDWGSLNTLAVGLGSTAYLRNASGGTISELVIGEEEEDCVTSVCWAPDGIQLAVGLENSDIQLWDSTANHIVRTLRGGHAARVGALAWNHYILTTGRMDGKIINYDTRARRPIVGNYRGHKGEVCGLKWSPSGQQLASGGDDNLVYIWDVSSTSSNSTLKWLHKMDNHKAAVRALAWCPFQRNLLASGGGAGDKRIKFWNSVTGACLNSVYIGAEVCSLIWSKNDCELLSSHGNPHNLTLREYPSMTKMAEFTGYTSRVLYMSQSPDGCRVASAGGEVLKTWKVFGSPKVAKRCESFGGCNRIQIR